MECLVSFSLVLVLSRCGGCFFFRVPLCLPFLVASAFPSQPRQLFLSSGLRFGRGPRSGALLMRRLWLALPSSLHFFFVYSRSL